MRKFQPQRRTSRLGLLLLTLLPLAACWGGEEKARLSSHGVRNESIVSDAQALVGPDANANGIRDDIDDYIARLTLPPARLAAARQLARVYQAAIVANSSDRHVSAPADKEMGGAISCVYGRFPSVPTVGSVSAHQVVSSLENLTANTEARQISYAKYNRSRNGSVTSLQAGDCCLN